MFVILLDCIEAGFINCIFVVIGSGLTHVICNQKKYKNSIFSLCYIFLSAKFRILS